jgi:prefoldin subunit 5
VTHISNTESDIIAQIERLEGDARDIRRRIEHVRGADDKRVLNKQLEEIRAQIEQLRWRLR